MRNNSQEVTPPRRMRTQDVKLAAAMASRYSDALEQVQAGKIPNRIREEFPREYVEEICRKVGLNPQYGDELVAVTVSIPLSTCSTRSGLPL
jgi:hypothetical protein